MQFAEIRVREHFKDACQRFGGIRSRSTARYELGVALNWYNRSNAPDNERRRYYRFLPNRVVKDISMATKRKSKTTVLREDIHQLVDELPNKELNGVKRFLVYLQILGDPLTRKLLEAPYNDEPLTKKEESAIDEAWDDVRSGSVLTMKQLTDELGLCDGK